MELKLHKNAMQVPISVAQSLQRYQVMPRMVEHRTMAARIKPASNFAESSD